MKMNRTLKKGGYAAILSVIVIAAVIVFNMIVNKLPQKVRQWDMSSTQIYSVGDTTKEILNGLDKDITIYVVADPSRIDERIKNFVERYGELSGHIKVEAVDPVLHPSRVSELEATADTLLVTCDATNKKKEIPFQDIIKYDQQAYYYSGQLNETEFDGEGLLTSAVSYVTTDSQKNVYATTGHGETGLSAQVSDMLDKSNLTAHTVNLLTDGGIPEDCALLILNAPQNDLANDELTIIQDYLNQGGNVMAVAGPTQDARPNLEALMSEYGMVLEHGIVADTSRHYQNNPYAFFPTYDNIHAIMQGLGNDTAALVINAAALTVPETAPDGVQVDTFLKTSDGGILVDENKQTPGTYVLGATATKELESGEAKLTVITAPALIDEGINTTFTNLSNLDIFMNAVTWNFDDIANVSIPSKNLAITYNTIGLGIIWGPVFIIVIPLITLIMGFVIWMKRRKL